MADKGSHHEKVQRHEVVQIGSDRSFGLVIGSAVAAIAVWPITRGQTPHWWGVAAAAVLLIAALVRPGVLQPLNRLWFKFGELLHRIVTPVILGVIYLTTIIPVGLAMRMLGKDPLQRAFEPGSESYWIDRDPPGPGPESLPRQF